MLVIGSITKCMEKDNILGRMEGDTVDSIYTIKNMGLASILGLTEESTLDNG